MRWRKCQNAPNSWIISCGGYFLRYVAYFYRFCSKCMRRTILFSDALRHRAWDIRSLNRPFAPERFLASITFPGEYL
jgi:hypothetical protein